MKKIYEIPSVEVTNLQTESGMLAGSIGIVGGGGKLAGGSALSKKQDVWSADSWNSDFSEEDSEEE